MGNTSALRAVASEIISASQIELAVEPWRFKGHDRGQHLLSSALPSSSQRPEVLLDDSKSPVKSGSGDMTSTAV